MHWFYVIRTSLCANPIDIDGFVFLWRPTHFKLLTLGKLDVSGDISESHTISIDAFKHLLTRVKAMAQPLKYILVAQQSGSTLAITLIVNEFCSIFTTCELGYSAGSRCSFCSSKSQAQLMLVVDYDNFLFSVANLSLSHIRNLNFDQFNGLSLLCSSWLKLDIEKKKEVSLEVTKTDHMHLCTFKFEWTYWLFGTLVA